MTLRKLGAARRNVMYISRQIRQRATSASASFVRPRLNRLASLSVVGEYNRFRTNAPTAIKDGWPDISHNAFQIFELANRADLPRHLANSGGMVVLSGATRHSVVRWSRPTIARRVGGAMGQKRLARTWDP